MNLKQLFFLWSLMTVTCLQAQELYMPRNIQKAFDQKTRSATGKPGEKYWQNHAGYNIKFKVIPQKRLVTGSEIITYENNSPDTLRQLAIRFVNNIHKPTAIRAAVTEDDFFTKGLLIKSLQINGMKIPVDSKDWSTVHALPLKQFILPNSKTQIVMEWEYPLSKQSDREGLLNDSTFYCAYAYPRISVYDDYNGWDLLEHNGRQEFYNDFNNYECAISVPKNYVVWATGELKNADEVLQPEILARFERSKNADIPVHVATEAEMMSGKITQQNSWNTWRFSATNVMDFCFSVSNNYIWDATSTGLGSKRVSLQTSYQAGAKDFELYPGWMQYTIQWYSKNWPGVDYPYPTMTAVQGFADMEYPMMVNDASVPHDLRDARQLADHEIAHTYFPFYMGTNETRYAYMDEGWATVLEYWIGISEMGKTTADSLFKISRVNGYIKDSSTEEDQPVITMSSQLNGKGYGNNSYIKAALSYVALRDYLGDELFKKALHHYMDNWNGKHPVPWDYFNSMNAGSGKNLNWFWNNWFFTNHYLDLNLVKVASHNKKLNLSVENKGGFAIPFDLIITYADNTSERIHQTPEVWQKNEKLWAFSKSVSKKVKRVQLDTGIFVNATDQLKTKDLF